MYRIVIILLTIVALSLSANSDKTKSHLQKRKKEVIDGYTLPPEPDPKINNATLLGIDSNHNGVRDDVERWIYHTYNHPIERGLFMQRARVYQMVILNPNNAKETVKYSDNALSCEIYWIYKSVTKPFNKYKYFEDRKEIKKIQFNTIKRHMAFERYNAEFSGKILSSPSASKDKCEFDKNGILGALK